MPSKDHDLIPEIALKWLQDGGAALATVTRTWGSAPRPAGSQLAVSSDSKIAGSVSGGCVEGAVVAEALDAQIDGMPRIVEFGVSDDDAFSVGLACGGQIEILVEPAGIGKGLSEDMLARLVEARAGKEAVALMTNVRTWERRLTDGTGGAEVDDAASEMMRLDRSGFAGDWFICVHNPPLRMIIVGGVHIAQPLVQMAQIAGYECVIVDPREAFASEARFPGMRIIHDWPDEAIESESPDARTAIVTLTHDPKIDDPAIRSALNSNAFYLGCLGSKRTHAKRIDRLSEAGIGDAELARINAPVGLDIGARSPAEVAVAVMAEITASLRRSPEAK